MASHNPYLDPASPLIQAYVCYMTLVEGLGNAQTAEQGLGGKLLYAGELDQQGRAVAIAGNVAGCATLVATADAEAQKQSVRDGVVDFLVTSLDEALRILKNEIRKKSAIAVCISTSVDSIEREMLERGVVPDLTRGQASGDRNRSKSSEAAIEWTVESLPSKWIPRIDAIALECLQPSDVWNRRWLQRLPRYLSRLASNHRVVCADGDFAARFIQHLRSAFDRKEIAVAATVRVASDAGTETHNFTPLRQPSS